MKISALHLLCLALLAGPVLAQPKAPDHTAHASPGPSATPNAADMSDAEVRKVDKDSAKLTLKHGEIKNLDMPPMTMVFQVKEPAWLDKLKAGDKVKFRAEKAASGYVVTAVEVAK